MDDVDHSYSATQPFSASVTHSDGNAVVLLVGELDLTSAPLLRRTLNKLVASGYPQIVLDLAELSFVDSQGLAVLIVTNERLSRSGRSLILRSPSPSVRELLQLMGLGDIFTTEIPSPNA
jgi:anti-sigma B factor antagonist